MESTINCKAIVLGETIVAASPLDNVLRFKSDTMIETLVYDFLNGELLTTENRRDFYKTLVDHAEKKQYMVTDHVITCVKVAGVNFLYVSLDNSVRANTNGFPLYNRLNRLCEVVDKIIKSLDNNCVVFFSESCRPSFLGGMDKKENLTPWLSMRQTISSKCGLVFVTEKRNNDDQSDMSFGVSAFCTTKTYDLIETYFVQSILSEGFGSGTVGIKMKTGEIVWGIHFPLDFKNKAKDNFGYKAMVGLQRVMLTYKGSVCAVGDFNTIPGEIMSSIKDAILPEYEFMMDDTEPTYFGSFYDTLVPQPNEKWTHILDS